MTSAEAWFSNSLRPRKPEGSLGRTAQDGHLDSHAAPELWSCGTNAAFVPQDHLAAILIQWQLNSRHSILYWKRHPAGTNSCKTSWSWIEIDPLGHPYLRQYASLMLCDWEACKDEIKKRKLYWSGFRLSAYNLPQSIFSDEADAINAICSLAKNKTILLCKAGIQFRSSSCALIRCIVFSYVFFSN